VTRIGALLSKLADVAATMSDDGQLNLPSGGYASYLALQATSGDVRRCFGHAFTGEGPLVRTQLRPPSFPSWPDDQVGQRSLACWCSATSALSSGNTMLIMKDGHMARYEV
jgi:hypothetical protein